MKKLNNLLDPKSIAIIGASEEEGKVGNVIARNILELGYAGEVFLINPKHEKIFGKKCYSDINQIEENIDLAIVAVPAKFVNQLIESGSGKVSNWVVVSAGFSEIGEEGKEREEELLKIVQEKKINILGPNCLGFIIPSIKLNASFASGIPEEGNVSFISQSGALAVALMDIAKSEGLSFSNIISVGNKMDIDESILLDYLKNDKKTKVVGLYLEGIKKGKEFLEKASELGKPVVVLKAGRTEKAQKAISSHTGSLAGDDEIMQAVFSEKGILRAENIEEFVSILKLVSKTDLPENEEVLVVTNAGGLGVLATDSFKGRKIRLAEISEESKKELAGFLPEESSLANPVDLLGDAGEERYLKSLEVLEKEKAASIICLLTPQKQTPVEEISKAIASFSKKTKKNMSTVFMGSESVSSGKEYLEANDIPNFLFIDQAISSLDKYFSWGLSKNVSAPGEEDQLSQSDFGKQIFEKVIQNKRKALSYEEAKKLFDNYGLPMLPVFGSVSSEINYPVVVKVDSEKVLHKTDQGGLRLGIKDQGELERVLLEMQSKFSGEKIIIQPMVKAGTEIILGLKKDSVFGPIIVFGLGGIYTEALKMVDFMLPEVDSEKIKKRISESKIGFLFQEFRGQKPHNLGEFSEIIAGLSRLALGNDWIGELDINPLIIYRNQDRAVMVDVKIIV